MSEPNMHRSSDDWNKLKHLVDLSAENARLKAEVERLTALVESNLNSSKVAMGKADAMLHERDSLKAEVERMNERNKFLEQIDSYLQGANENAYEKRCDELEAEVERLTKLCQATSPDGFIHIRDINAAKEGKQP